MSEIVETYSPDAADIAVIADGPRAYSTAMAGYGDYRPLAVRGQLRVDRSFLPQELHRDRLGGRLSKMAEEEGRRSLPDATVRRENWGIRRIAPCPLSGR